MSERTLFPIGGSLAVTIPATYVRAFGLQAGEVVEIAARRKTLLLRPQPAAARPKGNSATQSDSS